MRCFNDKEKKHLVFKHNLANLVSYEMRDYHGYFSNILVLDMRYNGKNSKLILSAVDEFERSTWYESIEWVILNGRDSPDGVDDISCDPADLSFNGYNVKAPNQNLYEDIMAENVKNLPSHIENIAFQLSKESLAHQFSSEIIITDSFKGFNLPRDTNSSCNHICRSQIFELVCKIALHLVTGNI